MIPLSKSIRLSKPLIGAELIHAEEREAKLARGKISSLDDIVEIPPHELEQMRTKIYAEGLNAGIEKERIRAQAELSHKMKAAESVLDGLQGLKADLVREIQTYLPELVQESVGRLLAAWQPDREAIQSIIEELLSGFDTMDHKMCIRLSPQALEILSDAGVESYIKKHPLLEFVEDPRLALGECLLEGRFGLSDARYSAKLKNLKEVFNHE